MPKKLTYLILHCTATPEGRAVTPADIKHWHLDPVPQGRGWKQVGYSDMILLNGTVVSLVPYDNDDEVEPWEITNGVAGINAMSRHIVYVGGTEKGNINKAKDTRTQAQRQSMALYCKRVVASYPAIKIAGHYQFDPNKPYCPGFDVPAWLRSIGIMDKNIYKP